MYINNTILYNNYQYTRQSLIYRTRTIKSDKLFVYIRARGSVYVYKKTVHYYIVRAYKTLERYNNGYYFGLYYTYTRPYTPERFH